MGVRVADGHTWISRGPLTDDHLGHDAHEAKYEPLLRSLLPQGGVYVDVGAHVGHWVIRLAEQASKVYAIEANPRTYAALCENLALNDLESVVTPINVAAWDRKATVDLTDPNGKDTGGSTFCTESPDGPVLALPLDQILAGISKVDLIKIDVEGAEPKVIGGARCLLATRKPVLFIEVHDQIYGAQVALDLAAELAYSNYEHEELDSYGAANYWLARPA